MGRFGIRIAPLSRPALIVAFLLTPTAVVTVLLAVNSATLANCCPIYNDEIHYWNEVACFAAVGFRGGYFVPDEHPASAGLCHFGPHGPGYPVVYGGLARVLGWYPASGPIFHLLALALGSTVWLCCCRPDRERLVTGVFVLATFWPCILYLPSTMQEGLHCAIALLLAGLAHRSVNGQGAAGVAAWLFLPVVAAASIVRLTWVLVMIPWACVALGNVGRWTRLVLLIAITGAIPGLVILNRWICAPYPNFASKLVQTAQSSPDRAFGEFVAHGHHALEVYFSLNSGEAVVVLQRYVVAALIVASLLRAGYPAAGRRPYLFTALNLALIAGLMIALYDFGDGRDCRVVAPHLLMCLLVLLAGAGQRWALGVAAIHVMFLTPFLHQFAAVHQARFSCQSSDVTTVQNALKPYLRYDAQSSAWANTVLVSLNSEDGGQPVAVPPGIGISYVLDARALEPPLKSRYILPWRSLPRSLLDSVRLRSISPTPVGLIYENLDCARGEGEPAPKLSERLRTRPGPVRVERASRSDPAEGDVGAHRRPGERQGH